MKRTAVLNIVGLTDALLGPHLPRISQFVQRGAKARINPAFPAVTCTAQSTYVTGKTPSGHGIVGNGWYNRELAEVHFWKQSNHVVRERKIWEDLREKDPGFTCAKLFWWFNMYSMADYSITPRPMYPADGRKVFDIYSWPYSIRTEIKRDLGEFPFPTFWGPAAGVQTPQGAPDGATRWIAESAKWIENKYQPTLNLVYLPHLDYSLQRQGPFAAANVSSRQMPTSPPQESQPRSYERSHGINPIIHPDLQMIDSIVGDLLDFFASRGVQVVLLSEYGITNVDTPIHLNRLFRQQGWLTVKEELGLELLDCGASKVFAVADHQVAHIYLNEPALENQVRGLLEQQSGIEQVLSKPDKINMGVEHERAGDLIAIARKNAWFTYYYWLDHARAPDFARTVDIHRKPGYDPVELFLDPTIPFVKLKIATKLLRKKLGFRMLMDVIPLDASLVKGSHGRRPEDSTHWPLIIAERKELVPQPQIEATDVRGLIERHVIG